MKAIRFLAVLLVLFVIAAIPSAAAPLVGPCSSVSGYDAACDVDHDGDIDIYDIQLTAGHWGQTGTYDIYPAMVPKTGQITSYGARDDGALQRGVAWPVPRFTDNLDGTVTDNLTGLIWLKDANCFGLKVWAKALSDANTLNSGECGLTDGSMEGDWRLPNVREMQSLVHYGFYNPVVPNTAGTGQWAPGDPFTGVQSYPYWSSTSFAGFPSNAFDVYLNDGNVNYNGKSITLYVWPVRGGQ